MTTYREFIQGFLKKNEKKLARLIGDILLLKNSNFDDFVDHIYPIELELKDNTDAAKSAPFLDLLFDIYSECRLKPKLYDRREVFNLPIGNFAIYMYQYSSNTCIWSISEYLSVDPIFQSLWFLSGLLNQGFLLEKLRSYCGKFYGHRHDLITVKDDLCHK